MYCDNCKNEVEEGINYCPECGNKIETVEEEIKSEVNKEVDTEGTIRCPKCGSDNTKPFNSKMLLIALWIISFVLIATITLLGKVLIVFTGFMTLFKLFANKKSMQCEDCNKTWEADYKRQTGKMKMAGKFVLSIFLLIAVFGVVMPSDTTDTAQSDTKEIQQEEVKDKEVKKEEETTQKEKEVVAQQKDEQQSNDNTNKQKLLSNLNKIIDNSKGTVLKIQPAFEDGDWTSVSVTVSDVWYNSRKHEKERFAEQIANTIKTVIKNSGRVDEDYPIQVYYQDKYGKSLAEPKMFGGYEIKR